MMPFDPKFTIQELFADGMPGEWFDYSDRNTHVDLGNGFVAVLSKREPITDERKQAVRDGLRGPGVQIFESSRLRSDGSIDPEGSR